MRIRTGHGPDDWMKCPPADPGSMPIRGSLVVGGHGPVEQRRIVKAQERKDAKKEAA